MKSKKNYFKKSLIGFIIFLVIFFFPFNYILSPIIFNGLTFIGIFKAANYHEINPLLLIFGYKYFNLLISIFAFIFILFLIGALREINIPKKKKVQKVVIDMITILLLSISIGCLHSILYYSDTKNYVIDDEILNHQKERISKTFNHAIEVNNSKIKSLKILYEYFSNNKQYNYDIKTSSHRYYNNGIKKRIYFNIVTGKDSLNIELQWFVNITTTTISFKGNTIKSWVPSFIENSSLKDEKLQKLIEANKNIVFHNTTKKETILNLLIGIENNHHLIHNKLLEQKKNLSDGYLSYDFFMYDTIMKALHQDVNNFRAISFFSRSLTIIHISLLYILILYFGGSRMNDIIKKYLKKK